MSWQPDDWEAFCALIAISWPGDFTDADRNGWRILLDGIDPQQAIEALKRLLHSGRKFYPRPAVSDLLAELRSDPSQPTFDEALVLLLRSFRARPERMIFDHEGEQLAAEDEASLQLLRDAHPLVASFAERQGIRRLKELPLGDPEWGEQRRRELRDAWDRHLEATDGREIAALASGREGLRQLDPLASLPRIEAGS